MPRETNPLHVGVLGGTRLPGNVNTFLQNIRDLLTTHPIAFDFDIVMKKEAAENLDGFNIVDPGIDSTNRAVETLWTLTAALTRYTDTVDPDVLFQVTKFPIHGFAATIAGYRTDTPVVTRYAGDNFREHLYSDRTIERVRTFGLNNIIGTVPARFSDATVVLGPHGRAEIERRNGQSIIREIPQPIDRKQFHPVSNQASTALREQLEMPSDSRILLTVGRLSKRKGMHDIATAARTLARLDEEVRWYVVGDGPLRELLESTPIVEVVGRVPHERIPEYYRAADLLVHPSLIEGLPNVLLEAAACGLPSISRDVGESATVASATYESVSQLISLVLGNHVPVQLGDRFEPNILSNAYADILLTASNQRKI